MNIPEIKFPNLDADFIKSKKIDEIINYSQTYQEKIAEYKFAK